jgi:hypothetical protein
VTIVKFNAVEEWSEELGKDAPDRGIVRLTYLYKPSRISPNIRHVLLVATHTVTRPGGEPHQVVRFERYIGDLWGMKETDDKVMERGEEIKAKIESVCRILQVDVRAGIFESPRD